jgi:hypothetical protein
MRVKPHRKHMKSGVTWYAGPLGRPGGLTLPRSHPPKKGILSPPVKFNSPQLQWLNILSRGHTPVRQAGGPVWPPSLMPSLIVCQGMKG